MFCFRFVVNFRNLSLNRWLGCFSRYCLAADCAYPASQRAAAIRARHAKTREAQILVPSSSFLFFSLFIRDKCACSISKDLSSCIFLSICVYRIHPSAKATSGRKSRTQSRLGDGKTGTCTLLREANFVACSRRSDQATNQINWI